MTNRSLAVALATFVLGACGNKSSRSDVDPTPVGACATCLEEADRSICGCVGREPTSFVDDADPSLDARGALLVMLFYEPPAGEAEWAGTVVVPDADLSDPDAIVSYSFPTPDYPTLGEGTYSVDAFLDEDSAGFAGGAEPSDLELGLPRNVALDDEPASLDLTLSHRVRGITGEVSLDPDLDFPGDATGTAFVIVYGESPSDSSKPIGWGSIRGPDGLTAPDLRAGPAPYAARFTETVDAGDVWLAVLLDDDGSGIVGFPHSVGDLRLSAPTRLSWSEETVRIEQDLVVDAVW